MAADPYVPPPPPAPPDLEPRLRTVEIGVAQLVTKIEVLLPTLATKADLYMALGAQTFALIAAGAAIAAIFRFWH